MAINCGHSDGQRGVTPVPVGRRFAISAPKDCRVSISSSPLGDASAGSVAFALLKAGVPLVSLIPGSFPPQFLSAVTDAADGDASPVLLTFIDSGSSGI